MHSGSTKRNLLTGQVLPLLMEGRTKPKLSILATKLPGLPLNTMYLITKVTTLRNTAKCYHVPGKIKLPVTLTLNLTQQSRRARAQVRSVTFHI